MKSLHVKFLLLLVSVFLSHAAKGQGALETIVLPKEKLEFQVPKMDYKESIDGNRITRTAILPVAIKVDVDVISRPEFEDVFWV